MHSRVLQPNICCMGNPVAGNPTQFVMARAARAAGLDWRFFTSQVATELFDTAFRGVQALGLDGVALMEPFQSRAIPLLDTVTEAALAMGKVNVARSDSGSWLGDNTLGAAIAHCIENRDADEESLAQGAIVVADDPLLAKLIGLAMPEWRSRVISVSTTAAVRASVHDVVFESEQAATPTAMATDTDTPLDAEPKVACVVMSKLPGPSGLRYLTGLEWGRNAACLLTECPSEKQLRPLRQSLESQHIQWVEPVELLAHQAAADFQFWTGVTPSVDLIRESLEEYLQW
jgi:shikimate dehydrogenase